MGPGFPGLIRDFWHNFSPPFFFLSWVELAGDLQISRAARYSSCFFPAFIHALRCCFRIANSGPGITSSGGSCGSCCFRLAAGYFSTTSQAVENRGLSYILFRPLYHQNIWHSIHNVKINPIPDIINPKNARYLLHIFV